MNWRAKIIKHNHEQRIAVYFEKDAALIASRIESKQFILL